jgi:hypothetical protein
MNIAIKEVPMKGTLLLLPIIAILVFVPVLALAGSVDVNSRQAAAAGVSLYERDAVGGTWDLAAMTEQSGASNPAGSREEPAAKSGAGAGPSYEQKDMRGNTNVRPCTVVMKEWPGHFEIPSRTRS